MAGMAVILDNGLSFQEPAALVTVAVPALATDSMPTNKLNPRSVQELYPEQDPADLEKLIATSKGLQKVCNAVWKDALCQLQFGLCCSVCRSSML